MHVVYEDGRNFELVFSLHYGRCVVAILCRVILLFIVLQTSIGCMWEYNAEIVPRQVLQVLNFCADKCSLNSAAKRRRPEISSL